MVAPLMVEVPMTPAALFKLMAKAFVPVAAPTVKVCALNVPSKVMVPVCKASPKVNAPKAVVEPRLPVMLTTPALVLMVKDWPFAVVAWMALAMVKLPPAPALA